MKHVAAILAVLSVCTGARIPHRSDTASIEVSYPQSIPMDRFEAMLHRASQILRSPAQVVEPSEDYNVHVQQESNSHTPNYYLPLYQPEKSQKLDSKSRQMQYMMPPPEISQAANFYAIKQKKLPKKFLNAAKQINVKVIADGERGELPTQNRGYSHNKENNVIFDDVFFGVDAQSAVPDDVPQEHGTDNGFIAPIYSRRLPKSEDMFATSARKREARTKIPSVPVTRFSIISF